MHPRKDQTNTQLLFPLVIPPDGNISSDIEFEVPPEVRDRITQDYMYTIDQSKIEFMLFDNVSGKAKTVRLGEAYDAYNDRLRVKIEAP